LVVRKTILVTFNVLVSGRIREYAKSENKNSDNEDRMDSVTASASYNIRRVL